MFLHRVESSCGRYIPKPKIDGEEDEHLDDPVPIQDQIEALRTKITLKEKYNRVLSEDFEDSKQGTSMILQTLLRQTRDLRFRLGRALKAEETAVRIGLRSHRYFQLAMMRRSRLVAIPWLEDKLFDTIKRMNCVLELLAQKRRALEDSEQMIIMIEKWPKPGTLPWEIAALERFEKLENYTENIKIKAETASILYLKYYSIKFILREEQGKYIPAIQALEVKLSQEKKELLSLQQMLDDAVYFRADAERDCLLTEKEASENRRQRKKQMAKLKRFMEKALAANAAKSRAAGAAQMKARNSKYFDFTQFDEKSDAGGPSSAEATLRRRKERVEQFRERARRLVEAMRVTDLTKISARFAAVRALGARLEEEFESKENFRNLLLKQKNQLILLLCHFRYSGQLKESDFQNRIKKFSEGFEKIQRESEETRKKLYRYGDIFAELRLIILAINVRLDDRKRHSTAMSKPVKSLLKHLLSKIRKLAGQVQAAKAPFGNDQPHRNYDPYVKLGTQPLPPRFLRVSIVEEVQNSESDDELIPDSKVPTRQEIKDRGRRTMNQAIINRGLRY